MPVDGARGGVGDRVQLLDERHGAEVTRVVTPARSESAGVDSSPRRRPRPTSRRAPGEPAVRGRRGRRPGRGRSRRARGRVPRPEREGRRAEESLTATIHRSADAAQRGARPAAPPCRRAFDVSSSAMSTSRSDQCSRSGRTTVGLPVSAAAQPGAQPARAPDSECELLAPEFTEALRAGARSARAPPSPPRVRGPLSGPRRRTARMHVAGRGMPDSARPNPVHPNGFLRNGHRVAPVTDVRYFDRATTHPIRSAPPPSATRVLAAWAASPARFREDANAEEDLVRGGYRDRLLVELAQNAADAAARAGVPGRLRLELARRHAAGGQHRRPARRRRRPGPGLAAGLGQARRGRAASGRFGVGFAAVLAVSDEPAVLSRDRRRPVQRRARRAPRSPRCRGSPRRWRAAAASSRCCASRGRTTVSRPRVTTPRSSSRCAPARAARWPARSTRSARTCCSRCPG